MFYFNTRPALEHLTDAQQAKLFRAILDFGEYEAEPDFSEDAVLNIAWAFVRVRLVEDEEKYQDKCEKRRKAGEKGGRPPKANGFEEKQKKQMVSVKANGFEESKKTQYNTNQSNNNTIQNSTVVGGEPTPPASNILFKIPTTDGKQYGITEEQVKRWAELYPAVDVKQSIRNILGYLEGNRSSVTPNSVEIYVNRWLAGDQKTGKCPRKEDEHDAGYWDLFGEEAF